MCKNISLTLRDTQLERTAKAICNQTYSVGLNRNPELPNKKRIQMIKSFWRNIL